MNCSLYDSFLIALPHLPTELISKDRLPWIIDLVRRLPPVHAGGFECRLGAGNPRVDFQQRILAINDEPRILKNHIAGSMLGSSEVWHRIGQFCEQWMKPTTQLHRSVICVWLEFDHQNRPSAIPAPSVFLSFKHALQQGRTPEEMLVIIESSLNLLAGIRIAGPLEANLRRCIEAIPSGAAVGDLGVMLSRRTDAVRLNVANITPGEINPYLDRIGWTGAITSGETAIACLKDFTDRVSLCLDVGSRIYPGFGLEGFLYSQPEKEPRWMSILDDLVDRGLCAPDKREALLTWPGFTDPTKCEFPWPGNLIIQSLLRKPDRFIAISRQLSHVKIVCTPAHPPKAKGYFGFTYQWLQPEGKSNNSFFEEKAAEDEA